MRARNLLHISTLFAICWWFIRNLLWWQRNVGKQNQNVDEDQFPEDLLSRPKRWPQRIQGDWHDCRYSYELSGAKGSSPDSWINLETAACDTKVLTKFYMQVKHAAGPGVLYGVPKSFWYYLRWDGVFGGSFLSKLHASAIDICVSPFWKTMSERWFHFWLVALFFGGSVFASEKTKDSRISLK